MQRGTARVHLRWALEESAKGVADGTVCAGVDSGIIWLNATHQGHTWETYQSCQIRSGTRLAHLPNILGTRLSTWHTFFLAALSSAPLGCGTTPTIAEKFPCTNPTPYLNAATGYVKCAEGCFLLPPRETCGEARSGKS